jgi:MFS transporter, SP family, general alpha glucoside:H+ symporter
LDILFENKVSARRFASTKVETLVEGTERAQKQQAARIAGSVDYEKRAQGEFGAAGGEA